MSTTKTSELQATNNKVIELLREHYPSHVGCPADKVKCQTVVEDCRRMMSRNLTSGGTS